MSLFCMCFKTFGHGVFVSGQVSVHNIGRAFQITKLNQRVGTQIISSLLQHLELKLRQGRRAAKSL